MQLVSSFERLGVLTSPQEPPQAAWRGRRYGEDHLYLLVRDPRRVFAAWEISAPLARRAAAAAAGVPARYALMLERADLPGNAPREAIRADLPDALGGEGWYLDLPRGGGSCRAILGVDLPGGFEALLTSRWVPIPPEGACRELGEWPTDDVRRAWLASEAERSRARSAPPLPSSASRYLASPQVPKP